MADHVDVVLIVIRGNSGSGKSTLAAELRRASGWPTAVLGQDHFRRIVHKEREDEAEKRESVGREEREAWSPQAAYPEDMHEFRTLTLVGGIVAAIGGLICGTAVIATFAEGFDGGANIGAGLLLLLGVPAAIVGGSILLVAVVGSLARRRRRASA